jgi:hypothetical protein
MQNYAVIGHMLCCTAYGIGVAEHNTACPCASSEGCASCNICRRKTGLLYQGEGLRSAPNTTRRGYSLLRSRAAILRTLGAGSNATRIVQAACDTAGMSDPECIDVLLLDLTPASYSSNDSAVTPGRRFLISPAQVSTAGSLNAQQSAAAGQLDGHALPSLTPSHRRAVQLAVRASIFSTYGLRRTSPPSSQHCMMPCDMPVVEKILAVVDDVTVCLQKSPNSTQCLLAATSLCLITRHRHI